MKQLITIATILIFCNINLGAQSPSSQNNCKQIDITIDAPDYSNAGPTPTLSEDSEIDFTAPPPGDPKIIYFVHGLGGNDESWAGAAEFTQGIDDIETYRVKYNQTQASNFFTATDDLRKATQNVGGFEDIPSEDRFIIAHSQGGLVSRSLDYEYTMQGEEGRTFEGIVTFGTPHAGAHIADQIDELIAEGENTIYTLAAPVILEHAITIFDKIGDRIDENPNDNDFSFFDFIVQVINLEEAIFNLADDATALVADMVASKVVPLLLDDFKAGTVEEFGVEDIGVHPWNTFESKFPTVAMYGIEDDPQFFRYLSTMLDEKDGKYREPFSMTDDQWMVDNMEVWATERLIKAAEWTAISNQQLPAWQFAVSPVDFGPWDEYEFIFNGVDEKLREKKVGDLYLESYLYLKNLNDLWMGFIGASSIIPLEEYYCQCTRGDASDPEIETFGPFPSAQDCNDGDWTCENFTTLSTSIEIEPNDAVVTLSSQLAFPGNEYTHEIPGANHSQERNSPMTRTALNKLFSGDLNPLFEL